MGWQEVQEALFYRFRIVDHFPADHILRRIDWLLDFGAIRYELEAIYSHTGRPSVDSELTIRILLIGYRPISGMASQTRNCTAFLCAGPPASDGREILRNPFWFRGLKRHESA